MSQTSVEILDNIAKLTTTLKDEDESDHDSNDHYLNSCENCLCSCLTHDICDKSAVLHKMS